MISALVEEFEFRDFRRATITSLVPIEGSCGAIVAVVVAAAIVLVVVVIEACACLEAERGVRREDRCATADATSSTAGSHASARTNAGKTTEGKEEEEEEAPSDDGCKAAVDGRSSRDGSDGGGGARGET